MLCQNVFRNFPRKYIRQPEHCPSGAEHDHHFPDPSSYASTDRNAPAMSASGRRCVIIGANVDSLLGQKSQRIMISWFDRRTLKIAVSFRRIYDTSKGTSAAE